MKIPKILIACPTAESKNYCAEEWLKAVSAIRWPNCAVMLVDNTNDGGDNQKYLTEIGLLHVHTKEFGVIWDDPKDKKSVNDILASGHNKCREVVLNGDYDYLLHLESDVIPDPDILEKLVFHKKNVVSGIYYRDEGKGRKVMLQRSYMKTKTTIGTLNYLPDEDLNFIDGTLKQVAHAGLGCCLIHKTVLQKIKFRSVENDPSSPDSWFAMDCRYAGISVYADTSAICDHKNKNWGAHGVDWK